MIGLGIRFLAGRYHATPWGHHVNEGEVEWPPAPWRLLRALTAVWLRQRGPEDTEAQLLSLLEKLSPPPRYHLPPGRPAHTRHYMPWQKTKGKTETTLVLDTFVATGRAAELEVLWPEVELDEGERDLLGRLARHLNHLGRAESWCEARVLAHTSEPNAHPIEAAEADPVRDATVTLLAADGPPKMDDLTLDTIDMRRRDGRTIPQNTAWTRYTRPRDILDPVAPRQAFTRSAIPEPAIARYALHAPALPESKFTLYIAEDVRRALMSRVEGASPIFSGRRDGEPRQEGHRHAFFLPEDADGDGRLDHLTIYSPEGFGPDELRALESFQVLRRYGQASDVHLLLLDIGPIARLPHAGEEAGPAARSASWISATPFVLFRHPKRNGKDRAVDQLRLELQRRGIQGIVEIEVLPRPLQGPASMEWRHFRRRRRGKSTSAKDDLPPQGFRIQLDQPVRGPIALGRHCHFGMGRFRGEG